MLVSQSSSHRCLLSEQQDLLEMFGPYHLPWVRLNMYEVSSSKGLTSLPLPLDYQVWLMLLVGEDGTAGYKLLL